MSNAVITKDSDPELHEKLMLAAVGQSVSPKLGVAPRFMYGAAEWFAREDNGEVVFSRVGALGTFENAYASSVVHRGGASRKEEPTKLNEEDLPKRKKSEE